jgi:hypothetical protein
MATRTLTKAGLPNSCSNCGRPVDPSEGWYAEHDDGAKAGDALCGTCEARAEGNPVEKAIATVQAGVEALEPKPKPKRARKPRTAKPKQAAK